MSTVRTRIAPSPTGLLHVGTARTALFNYLFAKNKGGKFIARIEDTDTERSDLGFEKEILDGLRWLGIDADEGPDIGGPYAPYRQSERIDLYGKYLKILLENGKAFYCFHSKTELEKEKERQMKEKKPPRHFCEYRDLEPQKADELKKTKHEHIIRFKSPPSGKIAFRDMIRGELFFDSGLLGDISIAKDIDKPLYNFAVVIDDYEMKISHVIRGEDHISNTQKQILLNQALGFEPPQFAHLPLILDADRTKMSKRKNSASVHNYRQEGFLPEALFNFLALLGWNPGGSQEIFSQEELLQKFSLDNVQKSGAVFDIAKLEWMNGEYIRAKPVEELTKLCLPHFAAFLGLELPNAQFSAEYIEKIVGLEQPRLKKLSEIGEKTEYFFREPKFDKELLRWKNMSDGELASSLDSSLRLVTLINRPFTREDAEKNFLEFIGTGDKGKILWPLRVSLSGQKASPGPFELLEIIGAEKALQRLSAAKNLIR